MKRYTVLTCLMAFAAISHSMQEIKTRDAEVKSAESKRKVYADLDVHQYEQVGTEEAFKFVPRLVTLYRHLGEPKKSDVSISRNNLVAVVSNSFLKVHDMFGNCLYDMLNSSRQIDFQIEQAAINPQGTHVAFVTQLDGTRNRSVGIIDLATNQPALRARIVNVRVDETIGTVGTIAWGNTGECFAVLTAARGQQKAQIIIFERNLTVVSRYEQKDWFNGTLSFNQNDTHLVSTSDRDCILHNLQTGENKALMTIDDRDDNDDREIHSALVLRDNTIAVIISDSVEAQNNQRYHEFELLRFDMQGKQIAAAKKLAKPEGEQSWYPQIIETAQGELRFVNAASNKIYSFEGRLLYAYPHKHNDVQYELLQKNDFKKDETLFIAPDGTALQYEAFTLNRELIGRKRLVVYDVLATAQERQEAMRKIDAERARIRYQNMNFFDKLSIKTRKACKDAAQLWRTDKKKFALYTAAAVVVVAAGVAGIKYAKKKKPLARALSAWRTMGAHKK